MNQSESIENLIKALIKVQGQLQPARFDADNPFYGSRYATLNAVWDSCRDLLNENELAVIQMPISPELVDLKEQVMPQLTPGQPPEVKIFAMAGLTTRLVHSSGEWVEDEFYIPLEVNGKQPAAQVAGSIITYLRRYALAALLGIVSDQDIDANDPDQARGLTKNSRSWENDNSRPVATGGQIRKLYALGKSVYGTEWKTKQSELVTAVSCDREAGPVNDVTRLYREEIAALIGGIKKKQEKTA